MPLNRVILLASLVSLCMLGSCTKDSLVENKVPVVNAGASKSLKLPVDTVTLSGSASDTDGHVVAYLWSQVSGPNTALIANPGSASTLVKGLIKGAYVFQLMATDDKGATGVDTASVVVAVGDPQTVTFAPSNNPNEFELTNYNGADQSWSGSVDIPVESWTNGGLPLTIRELIKFDLSSIPATATITSATLYLYSYPNPTLNGNLTNANSGSTNTMFVQRVTTNWSPASTTWFNQPSGDANTQVTAASTTQSVLDLNLNVTSLVGTMVNTNANYGFLLKLQTEQTYNSRIFVSSYNTTYPSKRPKLVITYQ